MGVLEGGSKADFSEEALGPEHGAQLGAEHLQRDWTIVLEVAGQVDRSHATAPELALERVAIGQRSVEPLRGLGQGDRSSWGISRLQHNMAPGQGRRPTATDSATVPPGRTGPRILGVAPN